MKATLEETIEKVTNSINALERGVIVKVGDTGKSDRFINGTLVVGEVKGDPWREAMGNRAVRDEKSDTAKQC
jgi:hypothetical protein